MGYLLRSVLDGVMKSSWGDFGCPKPLQSSRKFHEHEVLSQFSVFDEDSSFPLGRINPIDMLGVFNALPFGLLGYAVENSAILFFAVLKNLHMSILIGARVTLSGAVLKVTYGEPLAGLRQRISGQRYDGFGRPGTLFDR